MVRRLYFEWCGRNWERGGFHALPPTHISDGRTDGRMIVLNHINITVQLMPSPVQDASLHTGWSSNPLDSFFIIPYPFSAFPAAAATLSAHIHFLLQCPSAALSHSLTLLCPFPLSFVVLSSHFSLIFSPPGSGGPIGDFSPRARVRITQPSAELTVALSRVRIMADVVKGRSGIQFFRSRRRCFLPFPLILLVEFLR